jgi:RNA polymerase sigma-70 factor (ECF subfamily)
MEAGTDRFWRLLEPTHARALAFARALVRSRSEGDDLFHEALLRALIRIDSLRDDLAFRSWLYRIVITVHRNRCRRAFWRRFLPLGPLPDPDASDDAAKSATDYRTVEWSPEAAEATRRARAALATLPAVQREAIVLFEIEGWKVDQIAELHRVSASAVKSRLARGRDAMRAFYEQEFGTVVVPSLSGDSP